MLEDKLLESVKELMALTSKILGRPYFDANWFRLHTELRFFRRCLHFVPPEAQAYLIRDDGALIRIEKVVTDIPYLVTVGGRTRQAGASTPIYFTTQPDIDGMNIAWLTNVDIVAKM